MTEVKATELRNALRKHDLHRHQIRQFHCPRFLWGLLKLHGLQTTVLFGTCFWNPKAALVVLVTYSMIAIPHAVQSFINIKTAIREDLLKNLQELQIVHLMSESLERNQLPIPRNAVNLQNCLWMGGTVHETSPLNVTVRWLAKDKRVVECCVLWPNTHEHPRISVRLLPHKNL